MLSALDFILALLKIAREEGDVKVTPIKIQKIFFLLEKEGGVKLGLDFQPYLFGPYSQKLTDLLHKMAEQGLVKIRYEEVKNLARVTVGYAESYEMAKDVNVDISEDVLSFFREWVKKDKNEILKYVNEKYPEYSV